MEMVEGGGHGGLVKEGTPREMTSFGGLVASTVSIGVSFDVFSDGPVMSTISVGALSCGLVVYTIVLLVDLWHQLLPLPLFFPVDLQHQPSPP